MGHGPALPNHCQGEGAYQPDWEIGGILATMFDARTTHSREVLEDLRDTYAEKLVRTVTPFTVKLQDSVMTGQSILRFTRGSPAPKVLALEKSNSPNVSAPASRNWDRRRSPC